MSKQVGTIQIRLNLDGFALAALVDMCREANNLINSAKYVVRQHFMIKLSETVTSPAGLQNRA